MEEQDRVHAENGRHCHRETREIPLDDVRTALRSGGEAHTAEARLAP